MARWDRRTRLTSELGLRDETKRGLASAQRGMQGFFSSMNRSAGIAGQAVSGAFMGHAAFAAAAAGASMLTFATDAITHFAAVERKWAEVTTLMPDLNEEAVGRMKGQIDRFARDAGVTLTDAYSAAYQAVSAGVDPRHSAAFLQTAHTLALAGVGTLTTSVDALTSAINAYGLSVHDARRVSDIFFQTVRGGKTTLGEMGPVIGQLLPLAAELNTEFVEIGAAFQILTATGLPTAQAATQIRGLLSELAKGQAGSLFQSITGETYAQYQASGGTLRGAVVKLRNESSKTGKDIIKQFGQIEAANAALALSATDMADKWDEAMKVMEGGAADAAENVDDTTSRALDRINAGIEDLKISAAEGFLWIVDNWDKSLLDMLGLASDNVAQEAEALEAKRKNWQAFFSTVGGYARRFYLFYGGNLPVVSGEADVLPGPDFRHGVGRIQAGPGDVGRWLAGLATSVGNVAGDNVWQLGEFQNRIREFILDDYPLATETWTPSGGSRASIDRLNMTMRELADLMRSGQALTVQLDANIDEGIILRADSVQRATGQVAARMGNQLVNRVRSG